VTQAKRVRESSGTKIENSAQRIADRCSERISCAPGVLVSLSPHTLS